MNRRGFLGSLITGAAAVAVPVVAAEAAPATPAVAETATLIRCPLCRTEQVEPPRPARPTHWRTPTKRRPIPRTQQMTVTCANPDCKGRFAVRWRDGGVT